jgi:hypothetical protein
MPDPAKSVGDIDDVLSSIRRLVAEQPSANRDDKHRAEAGASTSGGDGRLVLTPALRVTDPAPVTPDDTPMTPEPKISEAYAEGASEDAHRDSPDTMQSGDATDIAALDAAPDTVSAPEMDEDPTEQPVAEAWTSDAADGAGDMQPGSGEGTDHPDTDAADSHQDARIVGDAGWRPEMRLFDWEAAVAADDAANAERAGATSEFEPDTGDADWPGEGADRAVLDLAAAAAHGAGRQGRRRRRGAHRPRSKSPRRRSCRESMPSTPVCSTRRPCAASWRRPCARSFRACWANGSPATSETRPARDPAGPGRRRTRLTRRGGQMAGRAGAPGLEMKDRGHKL